MEKYKKLLTNDIYRNEIFKFGWSRKMSLKYDKIKYIKRPYTQDDLMVAIKNDSYKLVEIFLKEVVPDKMVINLCNSLRTFNLIYNYFGDEVMRFFVFPTIFVEKGYVDIISFLYKSKYKIEPTEINHIEMWKFLKNKDIYTSQFTILSSDVLIYRIKHEDYNYTLENAISEENMEVIDYFLSCEGNSLTHSQIENLINIGYNLNEEHYDSVYELAIDALRNGDINLLDSLISNGVDRDDLTDYCIMNDIDILILK